MIDSRAEIDSKAKIAENVTVGPWTIIGPDVEIGSGTWIGPHAVIKGPTRIGKDNKIFQFASVGDDPQDKKYLGEKTFLEIGDRNVIRECCTINRGTVQGGGVTRIGDDNLFMAYVHIAHDCIIANQTIFSNYVGLAGHVTVEDYAIFGCYAAVHQFCTIGAHSFIARATMVTKDVLPYLLVSGYNAEACGLNTEGLKRRGFDAEAINQLRRAYKIIFRNDLTAMQAMEELAPLVSECAAIQPMIDALQKSERGIVR